MPVGAYFTGHGRAVMRSMRRAHPTYSSKRLKAEFYATANARQQTPPSHLHGSTTTDPAGWSHRLPPNAYAMVMGRPSTQEIER